MVDEYTVLVETTDDVDVRKMSHPPKILGKCNMILYLSNTVETTTVLDPCRF